MAVALLGHGSHGAAMIGEREQWEGQEMSEGGGERLGHSISRKGEGRVHGNGGGALSSCMATMHP